jgi:hypothetical protein
MANIFATLIITSDALAKIDLRKELGPDLQLDEAWESFIKTAYQHTHDFCYNPFHAQALDIVYAGGEGLAWSLSVQDIWIDYVLVRNRVLDLASLHVHLRFPDIGIDLSDADERLTAIIAFIRDGLWSPDLGPTSIPRLQQLVARNLSTKKSHRSSLPFSRYSYVSVTRSVPSEPNARAAQQESEQGSIYRLLFLTENAITSKLARKYNDSNSWSAEEFFCVYHQPGGIVTVAEPYPPKIQVERPDWFLPTPPKAPPALQHPDTPDGHGWHYNHLPEYPPLRFLAVPSLDFTAGAEETLRDVHHEVMSTFAALSKPAFRQGVGAFWHQLKLIALPSAVSRMTYRMHAVENLEAIRLPVARQLVSRLLAAQLTDPTRRAISTLSQQGVSASSALVAMIALLLAVIPLLSGAIGAVDKTLHPTSAAARAPKPAPAPAPMTARAPSPAPAPAPAPSHPAVDDANPARHP